MTRTRLALAVIALVAVCSLAVSAPAEAAPTAKRQTVTLSVSSDGVATVTAGANGSISTNDRRGTWSRTYTKKRLTAYLVSASTYGDRGTTVSCTIKVNGKVVQKKKAHGEFAGVNCLYTSH